jgi:hypothetical protein
MTPLELKLCSIGQQTPAYFTPAALECSIMFTDLKIPMVCIRRKIHANEH